MPPCSPPPSGLHPDLPKDPHVPHPVLLHVLHAPHPEDPYSRKLYQLCHWDLSQLHFPMVLTQFKVDLKKVSVMLVVARTMLVLEEIDSIILDQDPVQDPLKDLLVHLKDQLHPLQDVLQTDHLPHLQSQDHFHPSLPLAVQDLVVVPDLLDLVVVPDLLDLVVVLDHLVLEVVTDLLVPEVTDLLVVPDQVDSMEEMDLLVDLDLLVDPDLLVLVVVMDPLVVPDQVVMAVDLDLLALAVITDLLDVPDPVVVLDHLVSEVVTDLLVVLDQVVTVVVMVLPDVLVLVAVMAVQDQIMVLKNLAEVVKVAGSKVQFPNKTVVPKPSLTVPITRNQQFSTNSRAPISINLVLVVSVTSMIR